MIQHLRAERTFTGKNRMGVKRDVLSYWHHNHAALGLSLKQFLEHCRQAPDGVTVTFRLTANGGLSQTASGSR